MACSMYVLLHPACCCSCVARASSSVPHPLAPTSLITPHGRPTLAAMWLAAGFKLTSGDWDVSSVTNMAGMFFVRVPQSRVLLLLRRHVVATRPSSPRSDITAYSTRPPDPRCPVVCHFLQSGHQHVVRPTDFDEAYWFRHHFCTRRVSVEPAAMGADCGQLFRVKTARDQPP